MGSVRRAKVPQRLATPPSIRSSGARRLRSGGPGAVLFLILTLALAGCAPRRPTVERLWHDQWHRHHVGRVWLSGVGGAADSHWALTPHRRGERLRFELINTAPSAADARLTGGGPGGEGGRGGQAWHLAAGGTRQVDLPLHRSTAYSLELPAGVVAGEPRLVVPGKEPRRLLLVVVDTLRNDHVDRELMPRTLAALSGARRFRDTTANATWTLPSMASLMTSRRVVQLTAPDGALVSIPAGVPTLASTLAAAGFATGAYVANYTLHETNGYGAGFASYWVPDAATHGNPPDATVILAGARRWLAAHRGEDSFLYLHFMEPHEPLRDHTGNPAPIPSIGLMAARKRPATPREAARIRGLYAGEVRYLDTRLGPFLARLPPETTVAFTADHGELLGEHASWGHGLTVYQGVTRVPLLLRAAGVQAGESHRPVQLLDLTPTLLGLMNVPPAPGMVGRSILVPGRHVPITTVTFSSGTLRWAWRDGDHEVILHMAPQPDVPTEMRVVLAEAHPLPPGAYYFDLANDPHETRSLALPEAKSLEAARVFVRDVGALIPGFPVLAAGERHELTLRLRGDAPLRLVRLFSVGPARAETSGGDLELRLSQPYPLALAVVAPPSDGSAPHPVPDGLPWNVELGRAPRLDLSTPGVFLWHNRRSPVIERAYEETLRRLRSLGYVQ